MPIHLNAEHIKSIHPFHIVCGEDLRIIQFGRPSIKKICPDIEVGADLSELFLVSHPPGATIHQYCQSKQARLLIIKPMHSSLKLKGQLLFIEEPHNYLFLLSPVVQDLSSLSSRSLSLNDFATHDPVIDYLFMLKAYQNSTHELTKGKEQLEALVAKRTEELLQAKQQAETEARQDSLTGLDNRRAFFEKGDQIYSLACRYNHPLTIIMFDIDLFKEINDTYGHKAGDSALVKLSEIVRKCVRSTDIVARIGGDEFALILPETDIQSAEHLAENLRSRVGETCMAVEKCHCTFTVSIGIAQNLNREDSFEQLLQHADDAMYASKKKGRNIISTFEA